ncbi:basic amino acid ABC transporter substrate-binding protein [Wielerella bovis]|uniref:basic amino acid ABC transporter substrate-binding protein n=1 Tax=Wielerella bovis TaxID=2917790 RepID=UPI0020194CDC|nr:basic amino acid ABC transporter substrate-binding protein [Wielerella bovis]ULJ67690.1 basic amino acid ABC transporter substrate-binding protein [Wielerella bovis]
MLLNKWIVTLISCAALSACGGQNSNTASSASAPAASTVGSATSKVFRVGTNAAFAPFDYLDENNEIKGFDVDLMKAMAEAGNFKIEYSNKTWGSLFPALKNGDIDIVAGAVTITDERKASMDFTEPYYEITQVVLVAPNKNVNTIDDLKNLQKIGVVTGNTGDLAAQKIFGATSDKVARFETVPVMTKEVENGGVEAAISDSAVVENYVKNNPNKGFKIIQIPDFQVEHYGIVVRKGDTETLNMLNDALKQIRANGKYDEIKAKYFGS